MNKVAVMYATSFGDNKYLYNFMSIKSLKLHARVSPKLHFELLPKYCITLYKSTYFQLKAFYSFDSLNLNNAFSFKHLLKDTFENCDKP